MGNPPAVQGEKVRVEFRRFVRPEKMFTSLDDLRRQISADIASASPPTPAMS